MEREPIRFGTLGTVKPIKGTDLLVDAFMQFDPSGSRRARHRRTDRQTLGRGAARARRRDPRIRFVGRSSQASSFLSSLDVFVLPSRSEGMSNALLEAMASGLPCIATDVGSNRSVAVARRAEPAAGRDLRAECGLALPRDARDGVERGGPPGLRRARPGAGRPELHDSEHGARIRTAVSIGRRTAGETPGDRTGAMRHRMTIWLSPTAPVRVVVVVSHLGLGGAERQTVDLLRQLRGTAWAPGAGRVSLGTDRSVWRRGTERSAIRSRSSPAPADSMSVAGSRFDALLRRERAGVIHAVNWFASGYSVLAQSGRAQIRQQHSATATCRPGVSVNRRFRRSSVAPPACSSTRSGAVNW